MRKVKFLIPLLFIGAMSLTSCNLFDESDLALHNHFNTPETEEYTPPEGTTVVEGNIEGKEIEECPETLVFKNIGYAVDNKIKNTYGVGGDNYQGFNVNEGKDYDATQGTNNYDLYVPNSASKTGDHMVILFVHGGAWISGFKTDVNEYVYEFANKGYITATIKYTLLKKDIISDATADSADTNISLSVFRDLDEIDACLKSIKKVLEELKFDTTKTHLVIGGVSSGSHLSMLYSYSRGHNSPLPISFVVNAVGPTDIKPYAWKSFKGVDDSVLNSGLDKNAIKDQEDAENLQPLTLAIEIDGLYPEWNEYRTLKIANGMCGLPYSNKDIASLTDGEKKVITNKTADSYLGMAGEDGGQDQMSVTYWMEKNKLTDKYPMVCAYAGQDGVVGIAQYANLQTKLDARSIAYKYTYFKNCAHDLTDVSTKKIDETAYAELVSNIDAWCLKTLNHQTLD